MEETRIKHKFYVIFGGGGQAADFQSYFLRGEVI